MDRDTVLIDSNDEAVLYRPLILIGNRTMTFEMPRTPVAGEYVMVWDNNGSQQLVYDGVQWQRI